MTTDLVPHRAGELDAPLRPQTRQMVQSIHLEERPAPSALPIGLAVLGGLIILIVAWAALAPVDQVVRAAARVVAIDAAHIVQDPDGGMVAEVMTAEGRMVEAGDPLMRLVANEDPAEIDALEGRRTELAYTVERMRALAEGREPDFAIDGVEDEPLSAIQRQLYLAEIESRDSQALVLQARADELGAEMELSRDRLTALTRELPLLQQEATQAAAEAEAAARSPLDVLLRRREVQQVADAISLLENEIVVAESAIDRTIGELQALDADLARQALQQAAAAAAELTAVEARLARAERRRDGVVLTSPVDGVVGRLAIGGVNQAVQPGQVLAEILPSDGGVAIEASLTPEQASRVAPDQPVEIQPIGQASASQTVIAGAVETVAGDPEIDVETGQPVHHAIIRLEDPTDEASTDPLPGTTATVIITVDRRSLLATLLGPDAPASAP